MPKPYEIYKSASCDGFYLVVPTWNGPRPDYYVSREKAETARALMLADAMGARNEAQAKIDAIEAAIIAEKQNQ